MVVVGAGLHLPLVGAGTQVSGSLWQKIAQLDDPILATASDEEWGFVAWCDVGHVSAVGQVGTGLAQMVVAFGDDTGPFPATAAGASLNDPRFRYTQGGDLQSWPAFWVQTYESSMIGRGAWPKARRPAIWARIDRNGDPVVPTASFSVAGVSMLAFGLSKSGVTTADWAADLYAPAQPQNLNASSRVPLNWRTFRISAFAGIFDGADDWLVAAAVRFRPPIGGQGAVLLQSTYTPDGSTAAQVPLLGRSMAFGWDPRGAPRVGTTPHSYQAGAFSLLSDPVNGGQFGLRGVDPNPSTQQAQVVSWELLAIRASKVLGFFHGLRKDPGTPPPAGTDAKPILFEPLAQTTPNQRELAEWTRPTSLDLEVVTSYLWLPQTILAPPRRASWRPQLASNTGLVEVGHGLWRLSDHVSFSAPEGVPIVLGAQARNLGPDDVQLQAFAIGNPNTSIGAQARQVADYMFAAWSWENDPDYVSSLVPAVPAAAYLSLEREGLSIGSLPELPIAPDVEMPHAVRREGERLIADDGLVVTWPSWLKLRRTFEWTWSGLSDTDRAALLAVIGSQFRWQRPRDTAASAWAPMGRPRISDQGALRSSVSGTFVELVWTGG